MPLLFFSLNPPLTLHTTDAKIKYDFNINQILGVLWHFKISDAAVGECLQQYPTEVIIYLKSTTNSETAVNLTTISSNSAVLSGLANAVPSDNHYTLDVTVTNTAGTISSTLTTTIS